jgi:hypothetical protein
MSHYDHWIRAGTGDLRHALEAKGQSRATSEEIAALVEGSSLPGLLALLGGSGGAAGKLGPELIGAAARRLAELPAVREAGLSADDVGRLLTRLFAPKERPEHGLNDEDLLRKLLPEAVSVLAGESGVPITPDEARRVARLLMTGEFFRDAGAATAAVLCVVPGLPIALVDDARSSRWRSLALLWAVLRDLGGAPGQARAVLAGLLGGTLDPPPAVLGHTLRALYGFATLRSALRTISELIHPSNETVRLAIVLYARANGIQIEPADLDALRASVLDPRDPNLGPMLVAAWARLEQREGVERARVILARLRA